MIAIDSATNTLVPTVSPVYEKLFNGMIGIQPTPSSSTTMLPYDFLESMKTAGQIDHKIISFFIDTNNVYNGVVEIGKWDYNGIQGNRNCKPDVSLDNCIGPKVHKTVSASSWNMYLDDITVGTVPAKIANRQVIIDPSHRVIKM